MVGLRETMLTKIKTEAAITTLAKTKAPSTGIPIKDTSSELFVNLDGRFDAASYLA